jgi:hypothetical protein
VTEPWRHPCQEGSPDVSNSRGGEQQDAQSEYPWHVFLGTPHRGSSHANLGAIIESALSMFQPFFSVNNSLVDLLKPGPKLLADVHEEFCV